MVTFSNLEGKHKKSILSKVQVVMSHRAFRYFVKYRTKD